MQVLFLIPVVTFVLVSGWFNYLFSSGLGDATTRYCWIVIGGAAAVYAALGLDLIRQAWKRGSPAKAFAAFLLWLPATAYDGIAAYGFATQEQSAAATRLEDATKPVARARAAVSRAQEALRPYEDAPEPKAAARTVEALEKQTNDIRCRLAKISENERETCNNLTKARIALAHATAKAELTAALIAAEQQLENAPMPPPPDKRAQVFGQEVIAWLPVVLLQLGTVLGVFAAALPPKQKLMAEKLKPAKSPIEEPKAMNARREQTVIAFIARLTQQQAETPPGLRIDNQGWIRGGQRRFAAAAGIPLTRFNRDAKIAWRKGLIEMKTDGNETAIRSRSNDVA